MTESHRTEHPSNGSQHNDSFDQRLGDVLRSLPQHEPGPRFNAEVYARIETRRGPLPTFFNALGSPFGSASTWIRPVLTAAALLLITLVGGRELWHRHQHEQALERIATLKAEQRALEEELADLRRLTAAARPVLHLGSEENVDLVFDLPQLQQGDGIVIPDHVKYGVWPELRPRAENPSRRSTARPRFAHQQQQSTAVYRTAY